MGQEILIGEGQYEELGDWLRDKKVLLVCGKAYQNNDRIKSVLDLYDSISYFSNYDSNPTYESVIEGINVFKQNNCDAVMAVGGGSAMDVAKCIKAFCTMPTNNNYLKQSIKENDVGLLVVPTTAGTGSEATRYAVIYYNGEKQSITSEYIVPQVVLLDDNNLIGLSEYQRKSTMLDAFSHALESIWSVNRTKESILYAKESLVLIKKHVHGYLNNDREGNAGMLKAAHLAGKAINITQTTAGHAMCYKITTLFGCAHGHATMMCNRILFPWMVEHTDCCDEEGRSQLEYAFGQISEALGFVDVKDAIDYVEQLYQGLNLTAPNSDDSKIKLMIESVNVDRLRNNPIKLKRSDIEQIYRLIFERIS